MKLTGLRRLIDWISVEACAITHEFAINGRGMSFFNQINVISSK
jgi:hypothetical protein